MSLARRTYREIESRRLTLNERTQKFLDRHPELIPAPLSYNTIGFDHCANNNCSHVRPREEMISGCCSFECASIVECLRYQS